MHWDRPADAVGAPGETLFPDAGVFLPQRGLFTPHPRLPEGVAAVVGLTRAANLFVQATPEGFRSVRNIITILDTAERGYLPNFKFSAVTVSEDDFTDAYPLNHIAANREKFKFTTDLMAFSAEWISELYVKYSHLGLGVRQAAPVPSPTASAPQDWMVPGYLISGPELMGDGSVRFVLETLHALNDVSTTA